MTLVIKRFKTALKGHNEYHNKNKSKEKRSCFKCGKYDHFIAQCPDNENDQGQEKNGRRRRRTTGRQRARHTSARSVTQTALHLTLTMRDLLHQPLTSPPSSPMSITHASWLRRRRYVLKILLRTLLLVMRNLMMM
jgi:hypothetical protein